MGFSQDVSLGLADMVNKGLWIRVLIYLLVISLIVVLPKTYVGSLAGVVAFLVMVFALEVHASLDQR